MMKQSNLRAFALFALLSVAGSTLTGCPKQEAGPGEAPYGQPASETANTTPASPPVAEAMPPGPKMGAQPGAMSGAGAPPGPAAGGPMMGGGGGGDPMAPLTPTPELDKAIADATAKGDKKVIAAAYASRGYSRMVDDNAGQRIKYRKALEDFRVALKNDPANAKAKQNMAIIEEIYTSMGRPVPQ